jgi:hypothetical protein
MQINDPSKFFKFPGILEKYKHLIYCPLDIPDPPKIDEKKIFEYIEERIKIDHETENNSVGGALGSIDLKSKLAKSLSSNSSTGNYPWNLVHLMRADLKNTHWKDFENFFPSLAEYFLSLPFREHFTISLLNQKSNQDVGMHTDPDLWFGIRFYLVNNSDARIFFRKAKEPNYSRLLNISDIDGKIKKTSWNEILEDELIFAEYPRKRFCFHLTSTHAAHGVEQVPNNDKTRITGFVSGVIDEERYLPILERSIKKYSRFAIWGRSDSTDPVQI